MPFKTATWFTYASRSERQSTVVSVGCPESRRIPVCLTNAAKNPAELTRHSCQWQTVRPLWAMSQR